MFEFSSLSILKQGRSNANKFQSQILYGFAIHNLHRISESSALIISKLQGEHRKKVQELGCKLA